MIDKPHPVSDTVEQAASRVAGKAEQELDSTRRAANGALDQLQHGVDEFGRSVPGALGQAVSQCEDMTRRGLERARQTSADLRAQMIRGGERSVGYVRDEPVKAVLIAAAAGAVLAMLCGWASRSRR